MADLTMKSDVVRVVGIKKKTRAKMFEDIEVGDKLQLSVQAGSVGSSRGRSYAVDVRVDNLTKKEHTWKTFNTLSVLDNFLFVKENTLNDARIERLEDRVHFLECLESAGVDNWSGYEYAQEMYREDDYS